MTTVYFFHGSMSSPQSTKIQAMKPIAEVLGYSVDIPDHSDIRNPDERVSAILKRNDLAIDDFYLVGSSMGGYVATVLSETLKPKGLFLLAPAFYMDGYAIQNPIPHAEKTTIIHGWQDDVVPLSNVFKFAQTHHASLHILDDTHNLRASIPQINDIFRHFLS
ncbi:MAG: YqiA/YcfP family alpha/beta fold hydrolase [Chloroflexota bacterium]